MQPKFNIGQEYHSSGKFTTLCKIVDIHTTYNSAGECVKLRYVAEHPLMGQDVTDYDVTENSVAIGIARMEGKL